MLRPFNKTGFPASCLVFSILIHTILLYGLRMTGSYDFSGPVNQPQGVMIDLSKPGSPAPPLVNQENRSHETGEDSNNLEETEKAGATGKDDDSALPPTPGLRRHEPEPSPTPAITEKETASPAQGGDVTSADQPAEPHQPAIAAPPPKPLLPAGDFLTSKNEKLTYVISLLGFPVGSAELEAKNRNGEIWITLRVRSNTAISSIYPVDDLVETRHIDSQFIMTRIKQSEGSFKADSGFNINLRKKLVSFDDFFGNRRLKIALPTADVLDTLSGFYYLRNRPLRIGKTEALHIFDSESCAEVPVEILRREKMRLPNLTKVDTLVVRPLQKTAGIFRRTGDILIWVTDDDHKVPVKIVTSIAIGRVTAELVSAETKSAEEEQQDKHVSQLSVGHLP